MKSNEKSVKETNCKLYDKMAAEQARYQDWLLTLPAADILSHASKYSFQEDILMSLESHKLTESQARALLKSPAPLGDMYKAWQKQDPGYMEDLWATMENRADEVIQWEQKYRSEGAR